MALNSALRNALEVTGKPPAFGQALRGAVAWTIVMAIGFSVDNLLLAVQAGFVAWIVSFCDDAIGIVRRFAAASVLAFSIAVATTIGAIAGNTIVGSVVASVVFGILACASSVTGAGGAKKGLVGMFSVMFAIGLPAPVPDAIALGLASIAGGLLAMLLMFVAIPVGRSDNQLRAAEDYFLRSADLLRLYAQGAPAEIIATARTVFVTAAEESFRDARYSWVGKTRSSALDYLTRASYIVLDAVTFVDVREIADLPMTPTIRDMFAKLADLCDQAAAALDAPGLSVVDVPGVLRAIDAVQAELAARPREDSPGRAALLDMGHNIEKLLEPPARSSDLRHGHWALRYGPTLWDSLSASLRPGTSLGRHTLRYVIVIAATTVLYKSLDIPDGFFITIAANIMLQPDIGRAVSRLRAYPLGTIAGSVVGAVLGATLDTKPLAITIVTAVVLFVMISYAPVTWWAFATGTSVFIVAALGVVIPGGWYLASWRVIDTVIASLFVLLGVFFLWPSRAKKLVPTHVAHCLRVMADYLAVVCSGESDSVESLRRTVARVTGSLGHRIEEYSHEPGNSREALAEYGFILIDIRRMYGLVTEMARLRAAGEDVTTRTTSPQRAIALLRAVANAYDTEKRPTGLPMLVETPPDGRPPPAEPTEYETELLAVGVIAQSIAARLPMDEPTESG